MLELVERELRASEALLGVRSLPIEAHQLVYNLVLQLEAPGQPEDLTVAAYGLVTGDLSVQRRLSGKGLMARLTDWEGSSR